MIASTPLRWRPDAGGLLPGFDGIINIHASTGALGKCLAVLRGSFTSLPGKSGKMLDKDFSMQIARETAQRVLQQFRRVCESFSASGSQEAAD
jgi:hypothetical protein